MTLGDNGLNIQTSNFTVNGSPAGGGGGGMPAKIIGSLSATVYSVGRYPNGTSLAPTATTATQLQIDSGEVIPNNTWTTVGAGRATATSTCKSLWWGAHT